MRAIVEHQLTVAKFGFRSGRGCIDAMFALRKLGERSIEFDEDLKVAFIEQERERLFGSIGASFGLY